MAKKLVVSDEYSPIFNRIILSCQSKKTTVSALLDLFATSRGTINTWKKGNINAETIALIADALDVTLDYLIRGQERIQITPELTEVEKTLLDDFRLLSDQGQNYIRQQMFMAREVYKKADFSETKLNAV